MGFHRDPASQDRSRGVWLPEAKRMRISSGALLCETILPMRTPFLRMQPAFPERLLSRKE